MIPMSYFGVLVIGLLHGIEPGHGWPIAFLYSIRNRHPMVSGLAASAILALFHFISSIVVVLAYYWISKYIPISEQILKYIAVILLVIIGILFWRENVEDEDQFTLQHGHLHGNKKELVHIHEHVHLDETHSHEHKHAKSFTLNLGGIALYAFILGFAHEEEFAILGFAMSGFDPMLLMIIYAGAVSFSLIAITLICIKMYRLFIPKLQKYQRYVPKISAITLFLLALGILFFP
jgi:nickel/cobalt exporter